MASAMRLTGDKELTRLLGTLGERVQRKALRSAVSSAASPVVKAAKAKAPRESGFLKKALGKKVVTSKDKQTAIAVVGARKSVRGTFKGKPRNPSRYLHLIEKPHIGPGGQYVPGQPFLEPAFNETKAQAEDVMATKLKQAVEREAAKGGKR